MNCSICNKELKSTNKTGFCSYHYQAEWRKNNKDYYKQHRDSYNKENKDKIKAIKQKYYKENKKQIIENCQKWYEHNKTKLESRYKKAKATSKQRQIDFTLTFEEYESVIKSATCHYCNSELNDMVGHGLDRVNAEVGYNISNVLPCCNTCNKARNTFFTVEEWEVAMKAILNLREQNE